MRLYLLPRWVNENPHTERLSEVRENAYNLQSLSNSHSKPVSTTENLIELANVSESSRTSETPILFVWLSTKIISELRASILVRVKLNQIKL